jgi:hypothetical protein
MCVYIYIYDSLCFHTSVAKYSDLLGYDTMSIGYLCFEGACCLHLQDFNQSFACGFESLSLKISDVCVTLKMEQH